MVTQQDIRVALENLSGMGGNARLAEVERLAELVGSTLIGNNAKVFVSLSGYWDVAYVVWRNRITAARDVGSLIDCADWLQRVAAPQEIVSSWAAMLAWFNRDFVDPSNLPARSKDGLDSRAQFVHTLVCTWLRHLFKFKELRKWAREALERWPNDPYFAVLRIFALAGLRRTYSGSQLDEIWERVLESQDRIDQLARRAAVDCLWVAEPTTEALERLRRYCLEALDAHPGDYRDYIIYYRLSYAYRHLGMYVQALTAVDEALGRLRGDTIAFFNEQFLRERELVLAEARIAESTAPLSEAREELAAATARLEAAESKLHEEGTRQALRLVEVVGIFSSFIAFLLSSVTIAADAAGLWQNVVLISLTGISILGFVLVLLWIIRRERLNL